jgi:tetratricopeptide (TPR) repeat protein
MQDFLLIWLDVHIDESNNEDYRNYITKLRRIVNTIDTFTQAYKCVDFLSETKNEKAFLIVSGALGEQVVPLIHDMSQLDSIYIFCDDESRHEQWAKKWSKVKGVFTEIDLICQTLQQAIRQYDHDSMPMSFISTTDISSIFKAENLDQLEPAFMYTQLFKEIFLEIDYNDTQAIHDLVVYIREQSKDNPPQLETITKFERDFHKYTPIWWYTCEYFLYSILNRALRTLEVDTILKMGFFICHLHRQIAELHRQQSSDFRVPFTIYRGQGLSEVDFTKLQQSKGGLMSFNNFLSTSIDRDISFLFADSNRYNPNSVGILFEITIDQSIPANPFALIDKVSHYKNEKEILFSMHTVFRIGEITQIDENTRLWQVKLTMTSDDDPQLSKLTALMQKDTAGTTGWRRLGQLLIKAGNFDKVEEVYRMLLDQAEGDTDRAHIYHQLGYAKDHQGDYQQAILFCEKTLEICQKNFPPNHPHVASSYNNIAAVYDNMGEYSKAFLFYKKALEIQQEILPSNHSNLATSYENIGAVNDTMGEYSEALSFYGKALEIRQINLPPNHPLLGTSYNNIGVVFRNMGEYSKTLSFYEKALEIRQRSLPPNHPSLATSYNNIGEVYQNMGEYSKALLFYEKALEIQQKILPLNHPSLATSYNNIGEVNRNMSQYSKALSFYEKALEIRQKSLPSNHSDLAISYNNIAGVYHNIGEYSKALSFYEKALEIRQKTLPSNHSDMAISYNNIAGIYYAMSQYSKALSLYEKAQEIKEKTLPPNHSSLATSYNNIAWVYNNMAEYSKAVSFFEKALSIWERALPPTHPNLTACIKNLEIAKKKL